MVSPACLYLKEEQAMTIRKGDRLILKVRGQRIPVVAASDETENSVQVKQKGTLSTASVYDLEPDTSWHKPGQRVRHQHKGDGMIESIDGKNPGAIAGAGETCTVKWDTGGLPEPLIDLMELTPID
jgi:hypothetical protein